MIIHGVISAENLWQLFLDMGGRFIVLVGSVGELKVSSKKVMVLEPVDVGLKFWVKG